MNFFERLGNGWRLGMTSLEVIRDHPKLLLFPVLSGIALISLLLSFGVGLLALFGIGSAFLDPSFLETEGPVSDVLSYVLLFAFYFINFFVVVFFNVGLVYCVREIFEGREVVVMDGLRFAAQRLGTILAWTAVAATVGTVLKVIQENTGFIGKILVGILGMAWSIMTYFVVPVLAYENVGPIDAIKRSTQIIKEKWGESIGAGFSFGLLFLVGLFGSVIGAVILFSLQFPLLAIAFFGITFLLNLVVYSAARSVFLAAAYEHVQGESTGGYYSDAALDGMFVRK